MMPERDIQRLAGDAKPTRDVAGRFVAGNAGGPGAPHSRRVAALRSALLEAVTPEDIAEIVRAMLARAKAGDIAAARELLDRTLGRVRHSVEGDSLDEPEQVVVNLRFDKAG